MKKFICLAAFALATALCVLQFSCGSTSENKTPAPYDYCGGKAPNQECYADKRAPNSENVALAQQIADRFIAVHKIESQKWDWVPMVMMFSLTELYRVTGEKKYQDYYKSWIDYHIEKGYEIGTSDSCSPSLIAATLYMQTGEVKYKKVVDDAFYYLDNVALRTEQGGISHLGDFDLLGVTLWLDSLFMFGNLMTRWGEFADDKTRLDDYGEQFKIFADLLQSAGGFFVHAYGYKPQVDADIYWGRGNGWITASGYDYLRARLIRGETDDFVRNALAKQVAAIISTQDAATGMWWTILNRPGETYLETSAGALFAYGMARGYRYGFLGEDVLPTIKRAVEGFKRKIKMDEEGRPYITGISIGTSAGTFDYYKNIAVMDDIDDKSAVSYGVGAVVLALIETSGLNY